MRTRSPNKKTTRSSRVQQTPDQSPVASSGTVTPRNTNNRSPLLQFMHDCAGTVMDSMKTPRSGVRLGRPTKPPVIYRRGLCKAIKWASTESPGGTPTVIGEDESAGTASSEIAKQNTSDDDLETAIDGLRSENEHEDHQQEGEKHNKSCPDRDVYEDERALQKESDTETMERSRKLCRQDGERSTSAKKRTHSAPKREEMEQSDDDDEGAAQSQPTRCHAMVLRSHTRRAKALEEAKLREDEARREKEQISPRSQKERDVETLFIQCSPKLPRPCSGAKERAEFADADDSDDSGVHGSEDQASAVLDLPDPVSIREAAERRMLQTRITHVLTRRLELDPPLHKSRHKPESEQVNELSSAVQKLGLDDMIPARLPPSPSKRRRKSEPDLSRLKTAPGEASGPTTPQGNNELPSRIRQDLLNAPVRRRKEGAPPDIATSRVVNKLSFSSPPRASSGK